MKGIEIVQISVKYYSKRGRSNGVVGTTTTTTTTTEAKKHCQWTKDIMNLEKDQTVMDVVFMRISYKLLGRNQQSGRAEVGKYNDSYSVPALQYWTTNII